MTGALDTIARKVALQNISKFGKAITFTRVTQGTYNPNTSSAVDIPLPVPVNVIVEEVNGRAFGGNAILADDKQITIPALGFDKPDILDTFTIDGDTFTIAEHGIKTIYSGELACLYVVQGHKS